MKIKSYPVIDRAVEEGIAYGYRRAFKHTDTPTEENIKIAIHDAVMNSLAEVIEFDTNSEQIYLHESKTVL
jgi:hypothetical protein